MRFRFEIPRVLLANAIILLMGPNSTDSFDYCSISNTHVMCVHKTDKLGPSCSAGAELAKFEEADIQAVLNQHNEFRSKVATGKYLGKNCAEAANMLMLRWDNELAVVAERHTLQCKFEHDENRDVKRFAVGQNIYMSSGRGGSTKDLVKSAIDAWFSEIDLLPPDFKNDAKFTMESASAGHFTQVIWGTSQYVGCGLIRFGSNVLITCNYGPAGNMINDEVYRIGKSCSACPDKFECSTEFTGLCYDPTSTSDRPSPDRIVKTTMISIPLFVAIGQLKNSIL